MPANERPPAPDRLTGWTPDGGLQLESALVEMANADLTVEGRLPWSSNLTFLVSVGGDDLPICRAVYKPAQGEQSLWDFPDGLYRREAAAYALSEALGWGVVPPTVVRDDGPFGNGSLQLFVDADYEQHYFPLVEAGDYDDVLRTICAFDVVANNADRKSGHVLLGAGERLWAIDHGLCFHHLPKLRTVIWDFAGDAVPAPLLADLERLSQEVPDELSRLLTARERRALVDRAASLVSSAVFPEPAGERPPYPWPLV